jgi:tetratricopeptide (TPR) repeat protein
LVALAAGVAALVLGATFWWPHEDADIPEDLAAPGEVSHPLSDEAESLVLAAEGAVRAGDAEQGLALFLKVPPSAGDAWVAARFAAADLLRLADRLDESIDLLVEISRARPDAVPPRERLALLFKLTGRRHAARGELLALLETDAVPGGIQPNHLLWLAHPERWVQSGDFLERAVRRDPHSRSGRLGLAMRAWSRGEPLLARTELAKSGMARSGKSLPADPDAIALEGALLREAGDADAADEWLSRVAEASREHPDVWRIVGEICEDRGLVEAALGAYLEALTHGPDNRVSAHKAGRLLVARGLTEAGASLGEHAERLRKLSELADALRPDGLEARSGAAIAELLVELGRMREAARWLALLPPSTDPSLDRRLSALRQRMASVGPDSPDVPLERLIPALASLRQQFPVPSGAKLPHRPSSLTTFSPKPSTTDRPSPAFVDESRSLGIDFTYIEGRQPGVEGRRMPEFTGGGVAVLDFDLDGYADLFFTQGGEVPAAVDAPAPVPTETTPRDRLFAGGSVQRFRDVTPSCGIPDSGYGQGVAAGDVNNDGFPDLYVANFGPNRLFLNQGDGTFVTSPDPVFDVPAWTTSVAIADLNSDGHPDLYDVNYVRGLHVATLRCPTPAGPRVCEPRAFEAEDDRLLVSNGDGTFRDPTAPARILPPGGKGLGLLIGPLCESASAGDNPTRLPPRRPDVFVANDTEANFLLVAEDSSPTDAAGTAGLAYEDRAISHGAAFGSDGRAQACMGVASADFNGDGRIDLFVTNFFNEPNALYLGQPGGLFDDRAHAAGLAGPSLPMLGFGTQALDVDLDGDADLVVANGDLDDFTHEGRELRMRPQLFLNDGAGRFAEFRDAVDGDYFAMAARHRGRGLARLDWNRDGREDFVVSHLDEPAALVVNRTQAEGGIGLRIVGTTSARDAIGATFDLLDAATGRRISRSWLVAGDGYQASNERRLVLGVGARTGPFVVEVRFPGGAAATLRGVSPRAELVVVEGRSDASRLPRPL